MTDEAKICAMIEGDDAVATENVGALDGAERASD